MKDGLEELSSRARRGELSSTEQRKLDRLLEASFEARLWHRAGCEFDHADQVLPGDHAAAERVLRRVVGALPSRQRRPRRRFAFLLIAAALSLASLSAAAVVGIRHLTATHENPKQLAAPTQTSQHITVTKKVAAPTQPSPTPPAPALAPSVPTSAQSPRENGSSARKIPKPQTGSQVAELFSAAARARRDGDTGKAIALYDSLQNQYPSSSEARASDMPLGMLHLKRGAPELSLEHFRRYLRHSGRGELAPEALWGEFQALHSLKRDAEARHTLSVILERYPNSAYAESARTRLRSGPAAP